MAVVSGTIIVFRNPVHKGLKHHLSFQGEMVIKINVSTVDMEPPIKDTLNNLQRADNLPIMDIITGPACGIKFHCRKMTMSILYSSKRVSQYSHVLSTHDVMLLRCDIYLH